MNKINTFSARQRNYSVADFPKILLLLTGNNFTKSGYKNERLSL